MPAGTPKNLGDGLGGEHHPSRPCHLETMHDIILGLQLGQRLGIEMGRNVLPIAQPLPKSAVVRASDEGCSIPSFTYVFDHSTFRL